MTFVVTHNKCITCQRTRSRPIRRPRVHLLLFIGRGSNENQASAAIAILRHSPS